VFGEQEAVVIEVQPFDLHGVTYCDVIVLVPNPSVEQARFGRKACRRGSSPATTSRP
jgi:hypothetical protein